MTRYRLYADGSSGNRRGKPGGWAWILLNETAGEYVTHMAKGDPATSNNIMELSAIIFGLRNFLIHFGVADVAQIEVVSDSQYALNSLSGNCVPQTNERLIADGKHVIKLLEERGHSVSFLWVKGHSGEQWNERVDKLATAAKEEMKAAMALLSPTPELMTSEQKR